MERHVLTHTGTVPYLPLIFSLPFFFLHHRHVPQRPRTGAASRPPPVRTSVFIAPSAQLTPRQESRNNPFGRFSKGYATSKSHFECSAYDLTSPSPQQNTVVSTL